MIKRLMWLSILLGVSGCFWASAAHAIIIEFQPSTKTVNVGASFDIDLAIGGLKTVDEVVAAFDLKVDYNSAVLLATGVTYGSFLSPSTQSPPDISTPGLVEIVETSSLSDAALALQQPTSFILATIHFSSIALGNSTLTFDFTDPDITMVVGRNATPLTLDVGSGNVQVEEASVPEPGTFVLLATGLGMLVGLRRGRS